MVHKEIYELFVLYFPNYAGDKIDAWFPNGKGSVRIRHKSGQDYVFSYHDKHNWSFETINCFLDRTERSKGI